MSLPAEREKGIEILRGKYTQLEGMLIEKIALKRRKGRNVGEKKTISVEKAKLKLSSPSNIYLSNITIFTELRAKGFILYLPSVVQWVSAKKKKQGFRTRGLVHNSNWKQRECNSKVMKD